MSIIQCAYVILSSVAWQALQRHDFREGGRSLNIKCVLVFFTKLSATFLILRGIERPYHKCTVLRVKYTLFLSYFNTLTPNDPYRGRTAPLTSKVAFYIFIQQIYVMNILNVVYTSVFLLSSKCSLFHNSNVFGPCIIHIIHTGCAKK